MLRNIALRTAGPVNDILDADFLLAQNAEDFQPQRVRHGFQRTRGTVELPTSTDRSKQRIHNLHHNSTLGMSNIRRRRTQPLLHRMSSAVLTILLVSMSAAHAQQDDAAATRKLEAVQSDIRKLRTKLGNARGEVGKLEKLLSRTEGQLGNLSKELSATRASLKQKQQRITELDGRRQQLNTELAGQREALLQELRAAYAIGRQEKLKLWLNQEDIGSVGRTLVYYEYFDRARRARIAESNRTLSEISSVEAEARQQASELKQLSTSLTTQQSTLKKHRQARKKVVASLKSEINSNGKSLDTLLADERELQKVLAHINEALLGIPARAGTGPFRKLKGKLPWPVNGKVDAKFGKQRGDSAVWRGTMIHAKKGQSVHAVASGRIAFADWMRGFGSLIILDHGGGYMSLYGHNESLHKTTGEWVEAGAVIARVGDSGGHDRTGLYFEIRHNGKPQNPARWCSKANKMAYTGG